MKRPTDPRAAMKGEGIDVAIRIGRLADSALVARKLGQIRLMLVSSPRYLARAGRPETVDDLSRHACIRDTNMRGDGAWTLYLGDQLTRVPVSGHFLVNSARVARDIAIEGEGIALCPDYVVQASI
jgi:DNA-binding transcriptional LysR family regulator